MHIFSQKKVTRNHEKIKRIVYFAEGRHVTSYIAFKFQKDGPGLCEARTLDKQMRITCSHSLSLCFLCCVSAECSQDVTYDTYTFDPSAVPARQRTYTSMPSCLNQLFWLPKILCFGIFVATNT